MPQRLEPDTVLKPSEQKHIKRPAHGTRAGFYMEQTVEQHLNIFDCEARLYNDVTTWLAETLEGSMRTPFEYTFDGNELYATDGGALKPIFEDALSDACNYPQELSFEYRRRSIELNEYYDMLAMMSGELPNTMIVISDFPEELWQSANDVGGYDVSRKQTMLRIISKSDDGRLLMQSQSLDLSDRNSLEQIYDYFGINPQAGELLGQRIHVQLDKYDQEFLIDRLTGIYDRSLTSKYGGQWYAGRRSSSTNNTYDFVRQQHDLIDLYTSNVQNFGEHPEFLRDITATIHNRYEKIHTITTHTPIDNTAVSLVAVTREALLQEVIVAGLQASKDGKTFSGCGMTLSTGDSASLSEMAELGFGNKQGNDKFGSLTFKCPRGHTNKRPRNKLIPKCATCGTSVAC